jgi:hypothetical protein
MTGSCSPDAGASRNAASCGKGPILANLPS